MRAWQASLRNHNFALAGGRSAHFFSLVLNFRYGLMRFTKWDRLVSLGFDLRPLGFPASLVRQLDPRAAAFLHIVIESW